MTQTFLLSDDREWIRVVKDGLNGPALKVTGEFQRVKPLIDAYREKPVRLVIVDLFLPESSGLDALRTLKQIDETLTVILITRLRTRAHLERAFRFGASDVLIYPVKPDTIRQTVLHRLEKMAESPAPGLPTAAPG